MSRPPARTLAEAGVSIWLDDLSRERLETGNLADLVEERLGRRASPPTRRSSPRRSPTASATTTRSASSPPPGADVDATVFALTTDDVRNACDVLRPVFDATDGVDGRVSIEVAPDLAHDTEATIAAARTLWAAVGPAQPADQDPRHHRGLPGDHRGPRRGHQRQRHADLRARAVRARHGGLPARARAGARANGHDLSRIHSVASFFVSRVDTEIDKRLDAHRRRHAGPARQGRDRQRPAGLPGLRGVSSPASAGTSLAADGRARAAAAVGLDRRQEPGLRRHDVRRRPGRRGHRQHDAGEDPARPSPTTARSRATRSDPHYDDAQRPHGRRWPTAGIDYDDVIDVLIQEGVDKFVTSWHELLDTVRASWRGPMQPRSQQHRKRPLLALGAATPTAGRTTTP